MDRYQVLDRVGKGTYGVVYKAKDKKTSESVALKTISLIEEEGIPSTAIREIALLKFLKHQNIVVMHDVIHMMDKLTMVFEYLEFDLKKYLDACNAGLDIITVKSLLYQLLQGLAFCHKQKVLHRDLKPANLLLNRSGILKLADFGLARSFAMDVSALKHEIITVWYRGPELLLGEVDYSTEVDLWSVGCIFAEMVNGSPLFPGATDAKQLECITELMGTPDHHDWPNAVNLPLYAASFPPGSASVKPTPLHVLVPRLEGDADGLHLLAALLHMDPSKRITAEAALSHPFFADLKRRPRRASTAAQQQQQQQAGGNVPAAAAAAGAPAPGAPAVHQRGGPADYQQQQQQQQQQQGQQQQGQFAQVSR